MCTTFDPFLALLFVIMAIGTFCIGMLMVKITLDCFK